MNIRTKIAFTLILIITILTISACSGNTADYTVDGDDIHILKDGATIADQVIEGDLYIDASVKDGEVYLENLEVKGTIYVNGGGANSVHLAKVTSPRLAFNTTYNTHVSSDAESTIDQIDIYANATIDYQADNTPDVTIGSDQTEDVIDTMMSGDFNNVEFASQATADFTGSVDKMTITEEAGTTVINLSEGSVVHYFSYYGQEIYVYGGTLDDVFANADYATLMSAINSIRSETGNVNVTIRDKVYSLPANIGKDDKFATGYPKANLKDNIISILYAGYKTGTVYILVENEEYGPKGTTPENVRDGISAGASDPNYMVLSFESECPEILEEYEYTINMESIMADMDGDMPDDAPMSFSGYVFVVFEDSAGNLSPVYTFTF